MRPTTVTAVATNRNSTKTTTDPWYVLSCDGGFIANEFELYNGSARRPRLAVVTDLQEASIFPPKIEGSRDWTKLVRDVLGIESRPTPIRFDKIRIPHERKDQTVIALI